MAEITLAMLLAAPPLPRPRVSLDTSRLSSAEPSGVGADRLRGWLLARLLEEGYAVVADPADGELDLSVTTVPGGFVVEAIGTERRSYHLDESGGSSSIVAMEILHRAMLALDQKPKPDRPGPQGRTAVIAFELKGGRHAGLEALLSEEAVLALSRTGITLAPLTSTHDRMVCLEVGRSSVRLGIGADRQDCFDAATEVADPTGTPAQAAQQVRDWIESAFQKQPRIAPVNEREPQAPVVRDQREHPQEPAIHQDPPQRRDLALGWEVAGGVLLRTGGNDPLLRVRGDSLFKEQFVVRVQGELTVSSAPPQLDVLESAFMAGLGWSEGLGHTTGYGAGLLGGARMHRYHYEASDQGVRWTWVLALPLDLFVDVGPLVARGTLQVGVAGASPDHAAVQSMASGETEALRTVWRRGAPFIGLTLGVGQRP